MARDQPDLPERTIWVSDHHARMFLSMTEAGLEIFTSDAEDRETIVVLDPGKIRELRLALQRYERHLGTRDV